ncbi:hypothetical protein NLJ89_g9759 [Agrocybe chaxingu]|uniref:Biotin-protein ligase N-terminal domain-containing protein n=1 Tax=Agrocybe chaxingu TaxID=84603 RepID=A0A9W8MT88_9AGAR|nr:hypothetical protein NLJ89_g9759 [Agrocybe chaxingu]
MNVLVYSGPETLSVSLGHSLSTLKSLLLPNFTVQSITQQALTTQPWQASCAVLVIPQSRDPFVSTASKTIKAFVEAGGVCLMLGVGASATPRSAGVGLGARGLTFGFDAQEEPAEPLKFYDKLNNCYISCDVDREEKAQPALRSLRSCDGGALEGKVYSDGTGRFTGFEDHKGKWVIAKYEDDSVAGLAVDAGAGKIALWVANIEYPLTGEPASSISTSQDWTSSEKLRKKSFHTTLLQLGLQLPPDEDEKVSILRPLPQFLTSTPSKPTIVSQVTDAIAAPQLGSQISVFKDANDEFNFHALQEGKDLIAAAREDAKSSSNPSTWQPKHIIVCRDGELPSRELTPLFDLALFYDTLAEARKREGLLSAEPWGTGEAVLAALFTLLLMPN